MNHTFKVFIILLMNHTLRDFFDFMQVIFSWFEISRIRIWLLDFRKFSYKETLYMSPVKAIVNHEDMDFN